ncbi:MAG: GIY-YIG nuclease family protein [Desulfobacula sp.]|uniref:GIY-YIG nuclease family protein n=1 Tax=Desulfobacula sp. TaxID=2593537 RepID=UPI0025C73826|nr:GIY-YIG nuclease family protein [Desulfobacula sp.]MCD4719633.1 GIY-YIG nuclease family protein [Desulfobacula sp.]
MIDFIKEINTIVDVLEDDALGLLGGEVSGEADPNDIFTLRNVPKPIDMPEYIAKRKPCDKFEQFEPLFKQNHVCLASKKKILRPFTSERQIASGKFFVLQGMMVYVANVGKKELKNFGNFNARLYCIFENGTESNMLLRSLAAALWKDENSRQIVDALQMEMFSESEQITSNDKPTGYIYVLRSLSKDPQIKEIKDLYKIGFSSQPVQQRIQNAAQEPTYLMADVMLVTDFETYNLNPQKLEILLHTFFAGSCLNLDIFDSEGKRYTPREWFIVPLHVIEIAINLLINGEIIHYRYDSHLQEIIGK